MLGWTQKKAGISCFMFVYMRVSLKSVHFSSLQFSYLENKDVEFNEVPSMLETVLSIPSLG